MRRTLPARPPARATALGGRKEEPKPDLVVEPKPAAPDHFAQTMQGFIAAVASDRKSDTEAADRRFAALQTSIDSLKTSIETTPKPGGFSRPLITGGDGKKLAEY